MHIDTIYETEAFRLLAQAMKDKQAVAICFLLMSARPDLFKLFDYWCAETLREQADEIATAEARASMKITIGEITEELIFKAIGITDIADEHQQALWDRVEKALAETSVRLANSMHEHNESMKSFIRQDEENTRAIARRDNRIERLKEQIVAQKSSHYRETCIWLANRIEGVHNVLFRDDPTDIRERYARFLEEVLELGQALDIPQNEIPKLVERTYAREKGAIPTELSDIGVTFASLCYQLQSNALHHIFEGINDLERPEKIAKVREKRKTRHGRGLLPGLDGTPESRAELRKVMSATVGDVITVKVAKTETREDIAASDAPLPVIGSVVLQKPASFKWSLGHPVQKTRGSKWRGHVVGFYQGSLTPEGYAVESVMEPGNVQVYPVAALEDRED